MCASSSTHTYSAPRRKVLPTVLNFMEGSRPTPTNSSRQNKPTTDIYDLLRRAVNERRRVEVLTRDCRGIYGILIGWLIVFDKHMNLIMSDVDEVFRRLTDGHDYLELGPSKENQPTRTRTSSSSARIAHPSSSFSSHRGRQSTRRSHGLPSLSRSTRELPPQQEEATRARQAIAAGRP